MPRRNFADGSRRTTAACRGRPLERALAALLERETTDRAGRKLRDTVDPGCRGKLLALLGRGDCEPPNVESERPLRPSATFRKLTNGFRSKWGAKTYADLCSIVGTGRRTGRGPLESPQERHRTFESGSEGVCGAWDRTRVVWGCICCIGVNLRGTLCKLEE